MESGEPRLGYYDESGNFILIRTDDVGVERTCDWVKAQRVGDVPHVQGVKAAAAAGDLDAAWAGVDCILDNQ